MTDASFEPANTPTTRSEVAVVVDSAAGLSEDFATSLGITIIEIPVHFKDDESGTPFWQKLRKSAAPPTTSAPTAEHFRDVYSQLQKDGAKRIVSVHVSEVLSATYSTAVSAAQEAAITVDVIDTRTVSAAQGLVAIAAAEAAANGDDALAAAESAKDRVSMWAMVETLDYLRKGGRIGQAQALLGTMLKIRPILNIQGGEVVAVARPRTRQRAMEFLVDIVARTPHERVVIVGDDTNDKQHLASLVDPQAYGTWDAGPVVGTHTGPGCLGVALLRSQ